MAYEDFKNRIRRTASNKVLQDKALNIAKNPKFMDEFGLASMVYNFLIKVCCFCLQRNRINSGNQQLAEELHEPIIRKFGKWKVYSSFTDNCLYAINK